jgi:hypothetical protein
MIPDECPDLPDTAMATGNDYEPGESPGPLDADERAILDDLRNPEGEDVVGVADEDRPEYAQAVRDETATDHGGQDDRGQTR